MGKILLDLLGLLILSVTVVCSAILLPICVISILQGIIDKEEKKDEKR